MRQENKYLLSIIIPIYNAEKYLFKTLQTLVSQTVEDHKYEIILINDGSTDNSDNICVDFMQNHRNILLINQENRGVSSARNKGLEVAKGKYITFVDSDDYVANNYVEVILKIVKSKKELYILNNYLDYRNEIKIEKQWLNEDKQYNYDEIVNLFMEYKLNAPWDKIFLKSIIDRFNIRFKKNLNMGEDLIFCLDYLEKTNEVLLVDKSIYYHVNNIEGLCHRKINLNQIDEFDAIFNKMIQFARNNSSEKVINSTILRMISNFSGKLYKNNYKKEEISRCLEGRKWYKDAIVFRYSDSGTNLRKVVLYYRLYWIASLIFKK